MKIAENSAKCTSQFVEAQDNIIKDVIIFCLSSSLKHKVTVKQADGGTGESFPRKIWIILTYITYNK